MDRLREIVRFTKGPEDKPRFPRFKPAGTLSPQTRINFAHLKPGDNPLFSLETAPNDPPYCEKAELRWQTIITNPDSFKPLCAVHEIIQVRVWDSQTKKQAVVADARVVIKDNVPIQGNQKNGLVKLEDRLYITSTIFTDDHDQPFVLVARHAMFPDETRQQLISSFFQEQI